MNYSYKLSKIIKIFRIIFITFFLASCGGGGTAPVVETETPTQPNDSIAPEITPEISPIYTDSELAELKDTLAKTTAITNALSAIDKDNTAKILYAFERSFEVVKQVNTKFMTYPEMQDSYMFQSYYFWENLMSENDRDAISKLNCGTEGGSVIIDFMSSYQGVSIRHDNCLDIYKENTYHGDEVIRIIYEDDEFINVEGTFANFSFSLLGSEDIEQTLDGTFDFMISKNTRRVVKVTADFAVNYPDIGLVRLNNFQIFTDSLNGSTKFPYKQLNSVSGALEVEGVGVFNLKSAYQFDESMVVPAFRFQFSGSTPSLAHLDVNEDYTFGIDIDGDNLNDFSSIFELYPSFDYEYYYYGLDFHNNQNMNPLFIESHLKKYTMTSGVVDGSNYYISAYGVIGTPFKFDVSNFFRGIGGKLFTYEVNAYPIRARAVKKFPSVSPGYTTTNIVSEFSYTQVEPGILEFNVSSPFEEIQYNVELFPINNDGNSIGQPVTVTIIVNNDNDGDGILDDIDSDDDNDGVNDSLDAFILDASEQKDTDGDFIGNNEDLDDDNDGYLDTADVAPLDSLCALAVQLIDGECALRNIPRDTGFVDTQGVYYYSNTYPPTRLVRWDVKTEEFLSPVSINRDEVLTSSSFDVSNQDSYQLFVPEQNRLYRTYYDSGIISIIDFDQAELSEVVFYVDSNEEIGEIYDYTDSAIVYREPEMVEFEFPDTPNLGKKITTIEHKVINLNGEIVDERTQEYNWYNDLQRYTRVDSAPYCPYGFTFDNETHKFYEMELDYSWPDNPCYWTEEEVSGKYVFASPDNSRAFIAEFGTGLMDSNGNVLSTTFDVNFIDENNLIWNINDFYLYADNVIKRYNYEGDLLDQMTLPFKEDINEHYLYGNGGGHIVIQAWGFEYSLLYTYKADE